MNLIKPAVALLSTAAIAATLLSGPTAASAAPLGTESPEATASVVRAAGNDPSAPVVRLSSTGDTFTGAAVSVSKDADSPVVIGTGTADTIALTLPKVTGSATVQTADGTLVRPGRSASTAVQALADGHVRALVTLHDAKAPKAYDFDFDLPSGAKLEPAGDGGLDIVTADGAVVLGAVAAPWAKDRTGKSLHTWYEVDGGTVTQHIDTAGALYPVVADPDVVKFCGGVTCSFYWKRSATKALQGTLGAGGSAAGIIAGATGCAKIPVPVAAGACAAAVVVSGVAAAYEINKAANRKGCFVVRINMVQAVLPTQQIAAVSFDDVPSTNKNCKA
ncbi:hypothetical protein GCM10010168_09160 [Actinoplanes ianthinogenes]|uniref:Uncharacterized protein n=1 Tax=Actinoplanes ianthinogenes TaxID=122358 RepID=A0ABM7LXN8_9ACTN|nr:hypothetical protein [Actinoplanes ianthinogenes]BCJ44103.1 hypothetical protein Aiant_47600 [Actinoplanes ianthinogenes]GGQ95821.1 hypothetical protein GCM10010168_09160 [Actinoplanes ianthinogenes]